MISLIRPSYLYKIAIVTHTGTFQGLAKKLGLNRRHQEEVDEDAEADEQAAAEAYIDDYVYHDLDNGEREREREG